MPPAVDSHAPSPSRPRFSHETLLCAVVEATRCLAASTDLTQGMVAAITALGELTGLDRVYVVRYDHAQNAGYFIAEHCAPGIGSVINTIGAGPYTYTDYEEVWRPLFADQTYFSPTHAKTGADAELNTAAGTKSGLFVPIFVADKFWGAIGFDGCTAQRAYSAAEIQVLRGAAATLAAAIGRDAAERARADEARALNHLLEGVVAASRALVDAADFQTGLWRWLATLAEAVDADRAVIGTFVADGGDGRVAIDDVNWTKPSIRDAPTESLPATSDFVLWAERLGRGESVWAHRDELADPVSVQFWERMNVVTNLMVPVVVDRRTVAWLRFDWRTRREWNPAYDPLLRTAADGAAAALRRNEAARATLAAREARAADLAGLYRELERRNRLLTAAARASALLSGREDFDRAVVEAMGLVAEAAEFDRVGVHEYLDADGNPGDEFWQTAYEWRRDGVPPQLGTEHGRGRLSDVPVFSALVRVRDCVLEYLTPELPDAALRDIQRALGVQIVLVGDITIDGFSWGAFACDDCSTARRRTEEEKGVIAAAARSIGQAIHRRRLERRAEALQRQIFAEREATALHRADELAALNLELERRNRLLAAAARSSALLSGREDFDAAVIEAMGLVAEAAEFDRAAIVEFSDARGEPDPNSWRITHEWCRPGAIPQLGGPHASGTHDAMPVQATRIRDGETIFDAVTADLPDDDARRIQESVGARYYVTGRIWIDGRAWGAFACDDCTTERRRSEEEKGVIGAAARAIGQAIHRRRLERHADALTRQILTERAATARARADELAGLNDLLTRRSRLLAAVTQVSQLLLGGEDPAALLQPIAEILGPASGADRAGFMLAAPPDAGSRLGYLQFVAEWVTPGTPRQLEVASALTLNLDVVPYEDWMSAGQIIVTPPELHESLREGRRASAIRSELGIPIVVDGALWGTSGFDDCTGGRVWDEGEITALKIANALIANAVGRRRAAEARARAEQAVLRERERSALDRAAELAVVNDELGRSNRLLAAAAESLKSLVSARDLAPAVAEALGLMGAAANMHRVKVILQRPATGEVGAFHELIYEWWAPEFASQTSLGLTHFPNQLVEVYLRPLRAGQSVWQLIDEVVPELREPFRRVGMQSMGIVPIFAGADYIGMVAFDDCKRRRAWSQTEIEALTIAARGLGSAIQRERLQSEKIEAVAIERAAAAKQRAAELATANAALLRSTARLVAEGDLNEFLCALMAEATTLSGAKSAGVFSYEEESECFRMLAFMTEGRAVDIPTDPLMEIWRAPVPPTIADPWVRRLREQDYVWFDNATPPPDHPWPISLEWHARLGHRFIVTVPLHAGGRLVGSLGQCFTTEVFPTTFDYAQTRILANHAGLALQLARLAESGRQSAVQAERNRMAREIHDTLAQSFTGILLQLEAADLLRETGDPRAAERYRKIRAQAQLGLAEARRTALALAPEALNEGLLPALTQLCQRSHVDERMRCIFTYEGLARRLGAAREERLLRVAKEALSNAVRHGRATEIILHLAFTPAEVTLSITDNGVGFTVTDSSGLGLPNMRAALAEAGGALRVASAPSAGTTVTAIVPLTDPPSAKHPIAPHLGKS